MWYKQNKKLAIAMTLLLILSAVNIISAQQINNEYLKVSLQGYLIVSVMDEKGVSRESLRDLPESILPGGVIQYEITAFNSSTSSADILKNVMLLGAIPRGTVYLENTVSQASLASFSIDGGKTYSPWPVLYKVRQADGTEVTKKAGAEMCTGIRWVIPSLKPQDSLKVVYRVKVQGQ